jgi:probable HAF family extracellular repeat protein
MITRKVIQMMNAILGLGLLAAAGPVAAQMPYAITDLGVLRGGSARVHALNSQGEAVGGSGFVYGTDRHAFLWKSGHGLRDLGRLPGGDISEAFGINDAGEVVGTSNTGNTIQGFTWTGADGLQTLSRLAGTNASQAYAVDAKGDVAGICGTHATLWTKGNIVDLGALPGADRSEAHGLNNQGQVVGSSSSPEGVRAFLWSGGMMQSLGVLPGDESSRANLINDQGMVVGASQGSSGVHAFLWTAAKGMEPLGTLTGGNYSEAFGINNAGQLVGTSGSSLGTRAMLWTAATGMVDLNTLVEGGPPTLVLTGAFAINDKGEIVAFGVNESNLGRNRESEDDRDMHHAGTRVFLLSPQ